MNGTSKNPTPSKPSGGPLERRGYQPMQPKNDGYQPTQGSGVPKPPSGGSGVPAKSK